MLGNKSCPFLVYATIRMNIFPKPPLESQFSADYDQVYGRHSLQRQNYLCSQQVLKHIQASSKRKSSKTLEHFIFKYIFIRVH